MHKKKCAAHFGGAFSMCQKVATSSLQTHRIWLSMRRLHGQRTTEECKLRKVFTSSVLLLTAIKITLGHIFLKDVRENLHKGFSHEKELSILGPTSLSFVSHLKMVVLATVTSTLRGDEDRYHQFTENTIKLNSVRFLKPCGHAGFSEFYRYCAFLILRTDRTLLLCTDLLKKVLPSVAKLEALIRFRFQFY